MKPPEKTPLSPTEPTRRKYARPVLREYGTIRAITRNVKSSNPNLDGSGMNAKT